MRPMHVSRLVAALLTAGLLAAAAGPAHAQFTDYDDFASGALDPEKWNATSVEGSSSAPTTRALRVVDDGSLRLALTSWGGNTSDSGFVTTRERLGMKQAGTLGGTGFITGMKALVTVLAADVQDCAANTDPGSSTFNSLRARAGFIGWFFNDGTGAAADRTGNILSSIQLFRGADGVNRIEGNVTRCLDAACTTTAFVVGTTFSTLWSLNTPLVVEFVWHPALGKFVYTVTNPATLATETKEAVYQGLVSNAGPPTVASFNTLQTTNSVKNCSAARKRVVMDALFDNVQVRRQP